MCLEDERCGEVVDLAWRRVYPSNPMAQVEGKIKVCQAKLKQWSRTSFGNITRALKEKKQQLRQAEQRAIREGTMETVNWLKWEINGLLIKEEKMWKQRSRALWLQKGDQNTQFFHNKASHRYKRNRIEELKNEAGMVCTDEEEISKILIYYYQNLFTSASPSNLEEVLMAVPTVITDEKNAMLAAEFVEAELEEALQQMAPLKAPGPDGLPPLSYQKFWPSIGEDVSKAVLNCLNSGSIPSSINRTFITLIPKVNSPYVVSEFRPISLCNVIYKIVSKVAANKLKKVLPLLFLTHKVLSNLIKLFQTIFWWLLSCFTI